MFGGWLVGLGKGKEFCGLPSRWQRALETVIEQWDARHGVRCSAGP